MIASFDPFGSKEKSITGSIIQHRRDSVIKCSNVGHCIIIFKAFKLQINVFNYKIYTTLAYTCM